VVARGLGYEGGAVLSICRFHAGSADNIIPVQARLGGTIRTFAPEVTERVLQRLREIVRGTADTFGVKIELQARPGYPVLVNDEACVEAVVRVAERVVGAERVSGDGLPMAGGEDFAYMARATRGAYFFVGSGDEGRENPVCHHPDFDFDDRIIPTAMAMMLGLVDDRLG
jgi:amidohydrolase